MVDRGYDVRYYTRSDEFTLTSRDTGVRLKFTRYGPHYKCALWAYSGKCVDLPLQVERSQNKLEQSQKKTGSRQTNHDNTTLLKDSDVVRSQGKAKADAQVNQNLILPLSVTDDNIPGTTQARAAIYPKRTITKAIAARQLQARLGYPPSRDLAHMTIHGSDITPKDLAVADHVFGPPIPALKGRTTKHKSAPLVPPEPVLIEACQTLEVDVMFVNGMPFLVAILVPLGYSFISHIPNRTDKEIHQSLFKIITVVQSRKITITFVMTDNEGAILTAEQKLNSMGIRVSSTAAGEKVHRVERRIRYLKERIRTIIHALPYNLCAKLLSYCVQYSNWCTNNHRMAASTTNKTPHELFNGRPLNAVRDLRHSFGDYVQATLPHTNNTMQSRTEPCIALVHSGSLTGGVIMYSIKTGQTCVRDQFRVLPTPKSLITYLNQLAASDNMPAAGDIHNLEPDSADMPTLPPPSTLPTADPTSVPLQSIDVEWRGVDKKATRTTKKLQNEGEKLAEALRESAETTIDIEDRPQNKSVTTEQIEENSEDDAQHNVDDNHTDLDEPYWKEEDGNYMSEDILCNVLNISVKRAMKSHGADAETSIKKELTQLHERNVWTPVYKHSLSEEDKKKRIRSFMFLKEKLTAEGFFDKLKSRLVGNGKMQDKTVYDTVAAPTAHLMSLLMVAGIGAKEGHEQATVDVPGAFLNADKDPEGEKVYVILDQVMTGILVDAFPEYAKYVDKKGELTVVLNKALYGCVDSALLWNKHITNTLKEFGFVPNKLDPCVFKYESRGVVVQICFVVLHVDDLFVSATKGHGLMNKVLEHLKNAYGETSEHRGTRLEYLGMVFDYEDKGSCKISMPGYEKTILGNEEWKKAKTPATDGLFEIDEQSDRLDIKEAKEFHTKVAQLLYLAKRTRPECLVAVSFLTTRVTKSTVQDKEKVNRVLRYIADTPGAQVLLQPGNNGMILELYVDASYGVHGDGKSHSGALINMGDTGAIYVSSKKQGIVAKASTEAELVALSDCAGQVLFARELIGEMGYPQTKPTVVHQDNKSTIALIKAGKACSERSRHINIRYFWIKEQVEKGQLQVQYTPTEVMLANLFTKAVQGSQFRKETAMVTGASLQIDEDDMYQDNENDGTQGCDVNAPHGAP